MRLLPNAIAVLSLLTASAAYAGDARLAPLPRDQAVVVHGPFAQGECAHCHERDDASSPGAATATNRTCLDCHDEFAGKAPVKLGKKNHPVKGECVSCHNPHNSKLKGLLLKKM
jgi:predicted CXXCH cytochrome family protein